MMSSLPFTTPTTETLQSTFLSVLPRIEKQARIYSRGIACAAKKADFIADVVALSWKWFCRLVRRGKNATQFISALASLAARAVRCGRRACGGDRTNDVLSPLAQRRRGFIVQSLPTTSRAHDAVNGKLVRDVMDDRLVDNTVTPPPEQAAFRIDFKRWMKTLSPRDRKILRAMSRNEKTKDLSRTFDVTQGRISQMRREFHDDWSRFVGDDVVAA